MQLLALERIIILLKASKIQISTSHRDTGNSLIRSSLIVKEEITDATRVLDLRKMYNWETSLKFKVNAI